MKRIIILVASLVLSYLLFSQDIILLYKLHLENPIAIPINEIDSISHTDAGVQKIVTKNKTIETQISEIDSLVFTSNILCPDNNHPHMVDLGLPSGTLWACCNVGANIPEGYGEYYAWGETEEKDYYSWDTYQYSEGSMETCQYFGNIAGTTQDVAHMKWGSPWRMPTSEEIEELRHSCNLETINYNNVICDKYTGPNGNYILIPYAGLMWYGGNTDKGIEVRYWSSEQHPDYHYQAYHLYQQGTIGYSFLFEGFPVRPVRGPLGLSLSEDNVNMFINSTAIVTIESGSGDYELQNDHSDIIDAELLLADKKNYPNAKDEIQIFGFSEGIAEIRVLNKKNNQTAMLVVNVKTPTDNDVAVTKQYSESVRDYICQQEEMPVEDFQNMVISWLDTQNYVKKTLLSPNRDLITITFNNGAIFRIDFQDISFFDENVDMPSNVPIMTSDDNSFYYDVSYQEGEKILDNANILLIQGRKMFTDNSYWEYEDLKNIISPVNVNWTLQKHTLRVFEKSFSSYGMVLISQTHGLKDYRGGFEVQDDWNTVFLSPVLIQYVEGKLIKQDPDISLCFLIHPNLFSKLGINSNTIIHGAYCWSYGLDHWLPDQTIFGYSTKSSYPVNREYLYSFAYDLLNGQTFEKAVSKLDDYWEIGYHCNPVTNYDDSKQRYFSIATSIAYPANEQTYWTILGGYIFGIHNLKDEIVYKIWYSDQPFDKPNANINSYDISILDKTTTCQYGESFYDRWMVSEDGKSAILMKFVTLSSRTGQNKLYSCFGFEYNGQYYHGDVRELTY